MISRDKIKGNYHFKGCYEDGILSPTFKKSKYYIEDNYEIEIYKINGKYQVREVGGKIFRKVDNHISSIGLCCLGVFSNNDISIIELFQERIFSYFYAQSFFKRFKKYPYGELSHYDEGIFEAIYKEIDNTKSLLIFEENISKGKQKIYLQENHKFNNLDANRGYDKIIRIYKNNPLLTK